tara:strand:+ start:128 stop:349 length:222 start_codon:yes stop_codon:yes gene_type:complete
MYNNDQKDTVYSYYLLTLYSISQGETFEELEYVISEFEDEGMYEECDGIRQAIEFAKSNTMESVLLEIESEVN